jgi:uncharacterized protein YrrD
MTDPVSWLLVEPGWKVVGADGEQAGTVEAVVGDLDSDIFSGLRIAFEVHRGARFVPAEHVASILDGEVHLDLAADAARARRFPEPGESRNA